MYNPAEEKTEIRPELALPEARAKYIPLHLLPEFSSEVSWLHLLLSFHF
jgi:hypothetical protein